MTRTKSLLAFTVLAALGCEGTPSPTDASAPDVARGDALAMDAAPVADVEAADRSVVPSDRADATATSDVTDAAAADVADVTADASDAGSPCALSRVLVTTSDFSVGGYALGPFANPALMAAGGMSPDQDHVPVQSGCVVYNLLRGNDIVAVLDSVNLPSVARRIPLRGQLADAGAAPYQVNPYDALTLSPTRAYVVQLALAHVAVVNPSVDGAAAVTGRIDLSPVRHPMDADASGSPEPSRLVRVGDRALVALQNLSAFAPIANGTLAVIDTTRDALVDIDGATPGTQGVTLSARNPMGMSVTPSGRRVVISSAGVQAFTPPMVLDGAIEALDATTLQPVGMRVTEASLGGDVSEHVMLDDDRGWALVTRLPSDAGPGDARVVAFNLASGAVQQTVFTATSLAGIARAPNGTVWVLDRSSGSQGVRVFNPDGSPVGALLGTALPPYGIAFVP